VPGSTCRIMYSHAAGETQRSVSSGRTFRTFLLSLSKCSLRGHRQREQSVETHEIVKRQGLYIFRQSAQIWRWGSDTLWPSALYPQENNWFSFMLEAESTPGSSNLNSKYASQELKSLLNSSNFPFIRTVLNLAYGPHTSS
jgi:hypothetical protein